MKNTKKTQKRQLFTQSSLKTITTTLVLSILICSGAIASSGAYSSTNTTMQEQQKILTRKDIGPLLLSLPLSKDSEQRLFLQKTLQQLTLKGELTEEQVQDIADDTLLGFPRIFLFSEINISGWGVPLPLSVAMKSYLIWNTPIVSSLIFQKGHVKIDSEDFGSSLFEVIGFYGKAETYYVSRAFSYRYKIDGTCVLIILLPLEKK